MSTSERQLRLSCFSNVKKKIPLTIKLFLFGHSKQLRKIRTPKSRKPVGVSVSPGQPRDVNPRSTSGPPFSRTCLPRRHPNQIPEPPQLTPFDILMSEI